MSIDICHISSVHYYFDSRIFYKECRSLAAQGFSVRFIARKEDKQPDTVEGVEIVPFPEYKNRLKRVLLSPLRMFNLARKQNAKVYHFHDPELLLTGVLLKLTGKKVIYDSHEDYSRQLRYKPWLKSRFLLRVIAGIYRIMELFSVMFYDRILAATEDVGHQFPARKTVVVRNVPILKTIDEAEAPDIAKPKPVIIYAGALAGIRGLKESIGAMALLDQDAQLWLLGKWESTAFQKECEALPGWEKVTYFGLKKPHEVYGYMKNADIGLSLLYPITNYLTSLPVKSFEYLACRVPMIMSDFEFWQGLFGDSAFFANPQDAEDVAQKINFLLANPEERERLKEVGRKLIEENYSWERESQKLFQTYNELLPPRS